MAISKLILLVERTYLSVGALGLITARKAKIPDNFMCHTYLAVVHTKR